MSHGVATKLAHFQVYPIVVKKCEYWPMKKTCDLPPKKGCAHMSIVCKCQSHTFFRWACNCIPSRIDWVLAQFLYQEKQGRIKTHTFNHCISHAFIDVKDFKSAYKCCSAKSFNLESFIHSIYSTSLLCTTFLSLLFIKGRGVKPFFGVKWNAWYFCRRNSESFFVVKLRQGQLRVKSHFVNLYMKGFVVTLVMKPRKRQLRMEN